MRPNAEIHKKWLKIAEDEFIHILLGGENMAKKKKKTKSKSGGRNREKKGSLVYQMHQRMEGLKVFGESRAIAKKEYQNLFTKKSKTDKETVFKYNKSVGIHCSNSYNKLQTVSKNFITWLKLEHPGIKDINDITEDHLEQFIYYREDQGKKITTIQNDCTCLNKLFNTDLSKEKLGIGKRKFDDITNNRELKEHHKKINMNNYQLEQMLGQATGIRRDSYTKVTKDRFTRDENGVVTHVTILEKGGKWRTAPILESKQGEVTEYIDSLSEGQVLFEKIPNRFPTHRQRQIYAKELYKQELAKYSDFKKGYKGFDSRALDTVSKALGHNRTDVVKHYLCVDSKINAN